MSLKNIKFGSKNGDVGLDTEFASNFECFYIGNVPRDYHSADLRHFFAEFIKKEAFKCFHYRHRPETQIIINETASQISGENEKKKSETCCCLVQIYSKYAKDFTKRYKGKVWANKLGLSHKRLVNITSVKVVSNPNPLGRFKSKRELRSETHQHSQEIYAEDLKTFIEFNPPSAVMPHGNVGTPSKFFHKLISQCKLPSSVIKSLGLTFPKSGRKKHYSSVYMSYGAGPGNASVVDSHQNSCDQSDNEDSNEKGDNINVEDLGEDHDAEDWERHEALHDDVDNQARPKERLFEEDLEVKWEKGGSGLVFYTDAYYWHEMKGKDFDEDTVDDWDVDYSVYYEDGAGDKAARDQLKMRIEQRRRQGKNDGPKKYSEIRRTERKNRDRMNNGFAEFEKHSTGFGSRILKKSGWKEGDGVGSSRKGISEPLDIVGQSAREKVGLGYYGEKLDRTACAKKNKAEKDVYISTIYDDPDGEQIDAMRFAGKELLKYRPKAIKFQNEKKKKETMTKQ